VEDGVRLEQARLLLGNWSWEVASSLALERIEEGPLGSIDLTLRVLALQHRMQLALVVVPAGFVRQWRKALASWAPGAARLHHSGARG
jgi:hypothetical protein